ncbi:MAG: sugar phosphate isomerase/epimerase [Syntrophales bacterium]|nr:sugar phosphate isomerase/epimerase [Syntrophales bacterium]
MSVNVPPVLEQVQVNMPFRLLMEKYLPIVLRERMNLEIGFDCFALDAYGLEDFQKTAGILSDAGVKVTFHAPFYDLRPGAIDGKIREVTFNRIAEVFRVVPLFKPLSVVCHAAFDRRYYVSHEDEWLENSIKTWTPFVRMARDLGTTLMLENVYEDCPDELKLLMEHLVSVSRKESGGAEAEPSVGLCFDTGHWNAFSGTPLDVWMEGLGPFIGQVHLHDNDGSGDEHLPVGEGTFPFYDFFDILNRRERKPIVTIEPHTPEALRKSLANIAAMDLLRE